MTDPGDEPEVPLEVDWAGLRSAAREVMAARLRAVQRLHRWGRRADRRRRVVVGCNVENASYGVGLCAECGMVSALHAGGGGRLVAVVCVGPDGEAVMPCGRCRQLLWENGGPDMLLETARGVRADDRGAAGRVRPGGPRPRGPLTPPQFRPR